MDLGLIIVIILRLIVPFSILRYPLAGFLTAILLDVFDAPLASLIGGHTLGFGGDFIEYNLIDKWLDTYFLFFGFLVSLRWQNSLAKKTASLLFWFRFFGVVVFSLTGLRALLFFFPNIFEFFYLYYLTIARRFPALSPDSFKKLMLILIILLIPKLFFEYLLHVQQLEAVGIINLLTPLEIKSPTILQWLKGY